MTEFQLDINKPAPKPKTLKEAQQLIDALWQAVGDLAKQVEGLKEQLETSSENSSQPPSQDSPKQRAMRESKKPTGKSQGAQPGHPKHQRVLLPESEVNGILDYYPNGRCHCGGEIALNGYGRHQVFDLPDVRYTAVEHRCHQGRCLACHAIHRGKLPGDVPSGQMGPGLVAWLSLLNGRYHLTLRQLESLLEEQWQLKFSLGAISEAQEPLVDWLHPVYYQIGQAVRQDTLAHADETTHFRGGSRYWLWSLSTRQAAYFMVHYSRGKAAANALLGRFSGILVTDRHGAYNGYDPSKHQYCWAHVIRNLEKISQRGGQAGEDGRRLLRLARLTVHCGKRWQQGQGQSLLQRRRLDKLRHHLRQALVQAVERHGGNKTGNACRKLLSDYPKLWTFLTHLGTPMTNNAAERSLRPYVIWRKTSFFAQSHRGNQYRPMMLSLIETCKRLGISAYRALRTICQQGMAGRVTYRLPFHEPARLPATLCL